MSEPKTELLVHVTAPSRGADDVNYRTLAAAYLSFEPIRRTNIILAGSHASQQNSNSVDHRQRSAARHASQPISRGQSQRQDSLELPELSFKSVADNLASPRLRKASKPTESQSSWQAPPSLIEDSNPDNNISIAQLSSPTRVLEQFLGGFESTQSDVPNESKLEHVSPVVIPSTRYDEQEASLPVIEKCSSAQVIPQSPTISIRKRTREPEPTSSSSGVLLVVSSSGNASTTRPPEIAIPCSRAESEPPSRKRRRGSAADENAPALIRSSSDIGGQRWDQSQAQEYAHRQSGGLSSDGLQIHSPDPPVSCGDLDASTIVSAALIKLARDLDLETRFQPERQAREIRPLERGYWLIDCATWTQQLKDRAWGFLANYLSTGLAGWGVWCRRDESFTWIRLYCWGCIVGHLHLVLYVASEREILYTGSCWIGGDGQRLILLGAKSRGTA